MSGFWLKWEKGLTRKAEVLQIAARLMVQPTDAAGRLMLVMEWLDDAVTELSRDGHADVPLKSLPNTFIDNIAGLPGFVEALAEVGWVTIQDNVMTFHNVGKHNGTSAKSRALAADRKRKERNGGGKKVSRAKRDSSVSVSVSALVDSIYEAYPRKEAKAAALKAITKAIELLGMEQPARGGDWLLERVKLYAAAVSKWTSADLVFVPHPATWFNRASYDDDPTNWTREPKPAQPKPDRINFKTDDYSGIST